MCRMLGIVSATPRSFAQLLEHAPQNMAVLSEQHPDGWGVALCHRGGGWTTHRSVLRALDDPEYRTLTVQVPAQVMLIHVRKKTWGETRLENTHPFTCNSWVFAHNGTLNHLEYLEQNISDARRCVLRGDTDSERLFAFLMTRLDQRNASTTANRHLTDCTLRAATEELDQLPDLGTASFLLSNGEDLGTSSRIHVPWTRGPGERGHDALGGCAEPRTVPLKGNWTDSRGKKNGVGQGSGDCGVCVGRSVTTLQGDG